MNGLDLFIYENPGTVVLVICALLAVSKLMSGGVLWFTKRTLGEMGSKIGDHGQRIRALETEHTAELRVIAARLTGIEQGISRVEGKVETHNEEAEKWKRTITAHGVRIEKLEGGRT
jgi:hypothetical protein